MVQPQGPDFFLYHTEDHLAYSFVRRRMVGGGDPFLGQLPPPRQFSPWKRGGMDSDEREGYTRR